MNVTVTQAWASPSVLHLRLLVEFKSGRRVQFASCHLRLEDIDGWPLSPVEERDSDAETEQLTLDLG